MTSRPQHKPTDKTRNEVATLSSVGIPQEDIAVFLKIDAKTLRKHYRTELDTACTRANAAVANALYKAAIGGNIAACTFWLKTRARWRETGEREEQTEAQPVHITVSVEDARKP